MISLGDISRILQPVKNKIFRMIARGIVSAINDAEMTQKLQIMVLKGDTRTGVERFENYGIASCPLVGAEALIHAFNGNTDLNIVSNVHDRRHRPDYLASGDVSVYTFEDSTGEKFRIWLRNGELIQVDCDTIVVNARTAATLNTKTAVVNATISATLNTPDAVVNATTKTDINSPIINLNTDALNINKFTGGGPQPTATINADIVQTGDKTQTGDVGLTGNIVQNGTVNQTGSCDIVGAVGVTGNINASGNIIDGGSNTNHHSH